MLPRDVDGINLRASQVVVVTAEKIGRVFIAQFFFSKEDNFLNYYSTQLQSVYLQYDNRYCKPYLQLCRALFK